MGGRQVDDVDDVLQNINEQNDAMEQINAAMGQPIGPSADIDEDDLEAEFEVGRLPLPLRPRSVTCLGGGGGVRAVDLFVHRWTTAGREFCMQSGGLSSCERGRGRGLGRRRCRPASWTRSCWSPPLCRRPVPSSRPSPRPPLAPPCRPFPPVCLTLLNVRTEHKQLQPEDTEGLPSSHCAWCCVI